MTDTSVVFNAIGKDSGVGSMLGKFKGLFKSTGVEGAASMKVVDREVEKLDHDIKQAKDSLTSLAREFAFAAAGAEKLKISRQMGRQSSELGKLTKAKNLLEDVVDPEEAVGVGTKLGAKLTEGLSTSLEGAGPFLAAGLASALTYGLPFLAATISGAILGAAGIGGVVGGVMLAAKDSRVQAAWKELSKSAGDELKTAAQPFIPATLSAIATVKSALADLGTPLTSIFSGAAGYLAPLTKGLTGLIANVAKGFQSAVASAGPVIAVISRDLPDIGHSIMGLFAVAAEHADAAAQAIDTVFKIISAGIDLVSFFVDQLAKAYEFINKMGGGKLLGWLGLLDKAPPKLAAATEGTTLFNDATDDTTKAAATAADSLKTLQTELDDFADSNLSASEAQIAARQAIADTTKTLKENGKNLDINKSKGRENITALNQLARSFNTVTTSNDKANLEGGESAKIYGQQRSAFIKAAEAAGMAGGAASDLADQVLKLPKSKTINLNASGDALADANAVRRALNGIPTYKNIYIQGHVDKVASQLSRYGFDARAAGGPVARGVPYLVGEEGPELVVPDNNATVLSNSKTRAALTGGARTSAAVPSLGAMGNGGGGNVLRIEVVGERRVAEFFRYLIRTYNLVDGAIT